MIQRLLARLIPIEFGRLDEGFFIFGTNVRMSDELLKDAGLVAIGMNMEEVR